MTKLLIAMALLSALEISADAALADDAGAPPNIVFIMADDKCDELAEDQLKSLHFDSFSRSFAPSGNCGQFGQIQLNPKELTTLCYIRGR